MSNILQTSPIKVSDHLTEEFAWTNKRHLAEKLGIFSAMSPEVMKKCEDWALKNGIDIQPEKSTE